MSSRGNVARAHRSEEASPVFSGNSLLLVVPVELYEILIRRGEIEGRSPGSVLSDAIEDYESSAEAPTRESCERERVLKVI